MSFNPSPAMRRELRNQERKAYHTAVTVVLPNAGASYDSGWFVFLHGSSRDISAMGLCFTCPHAFEEKDILLSLRLPDGRCGVLEAEVVSSREVDGGREYRAKFCRPEQLVETTAP